MPPDNLVYRVVGFFAQQVRKLTNAGAPKHGAIGWLLVVGGILILVSLLHWLAGKLHPILQFSLHVGVLYLTVGFRQFSHAFTEIQQLLAEGKVDEARETLRRWLAGSHDDDLAENVLQGRSLKPEQRNDLPATEICRLAIADALVAAHRHVFGPLLWYVLLPGLIGPVLYRSAELLARLWSEKRSAQTQLLVDSPVAQDEITYGEFASQAYYWIDWPAVRLSSAAFAVVGNFEDAIYCWRGAKSSQASALDAASDTQSLSTIPLMNEQRTLLLAAGGGALGMRIADAEVQAQWNQEDSGFDWQGSVPNPQGLHAAVGLVWRSVVLLIALFGMVTIANWLGR